MRRLVLALVLLLLVPSAPAHAGATVDTGGFASATNGIARAADGTFWVAEEFAGSVVRTSATGQVIGPRIAVGGTPVDVVAGPGGTVWVSVPSATKVVRIDTGSLTATDAAVGPCAPTALADGGNGRIYYSCPAMGIIRALRASDGGSTDGTVSQVGTVYDLTVAGGKLYAPDYDGDAVRRIRILPGVSPVVEAAYGAPAGGHPNGIAALGSDVWVTLASGSLARVDAAAANGTALTTVAPSLPLTDPAGLAATAYGALYVTSGAGATRLAEVSTTGVVSPIGVPADATPSTVAMTDGGALVTDRSRAAVLRVVDGAAVLGTASVTVTSATTATVTVPIETGGNATTWRVGGATGTLPASATGPTTVTASLTGLTPGTVNQLALQAQNARGSVAATGFSVTTPAGPRLVSKAEVGESGTRLKKLSVVGLVGGESVKVTCKGAGCPAKRKRTYAGVAAGTLKITLLKKATLRPGAKVRVTVTGAAPSTTTLKIRAGKPPEAS